MYQIPDAPQTFEDISTGCIDDFFRLVALELQKNIRTKGDFCQISIEDLAGRLGWRPSMPMTKLLIKELASKGWDVYYHTACSLEGEKLREATDVMTITPSVIPRIIGDA